MPSKAGWFFDGWTSGLLILVLRARGASTIHHVTTGGGGQGVRSPGDEGGGVGYVV